MNVRTKIVSLVQGIVPIHPQVVPQDADFPAAVYTIVSSVPSSVKGMPSLVNNYRVRIDIYAKTMAEASGIASIITTTLDNYHDVDYRIHLQDDSDDYEVDTKLYRISLEFNVRENQ